MATAYILYNPLAGNGRSREDVQLLQMQLPDPAKYYDMTRITNYSAFLTQLDREDYLVVAGGDGTLNRFVNDTDGLQITQPILYYPLGTGNDFAYDLGYKPQSGPFPVTQLLQQLPCVQVQGRSYRFINGVGFGIDGYCCQIGDEKRKLPGKKVSYTAIAIRGLLFAFAARNARVTVDGRTCCYEKVWIAPTMYGKHYGGGMMPAPEQDRSNRERTLSVMIFHGGGRLRTLCAFPGIFKGTHIKHKKLVAIHTGHQITVEFDRPTPLQIDGETFLNVTTYTATLNSQPDAERNDK